MRSAHIVSSIGYTRTCGRRASQLIASHRVVVTHIVGLGICTKSAASIFIATKECGVGLFLDHFVEDAWLECWGTHARRRPLRILFRYCTSQSCIFSRIYLPKILAGSIGYAVVTSLQNGGRTADYSAIHSPVVCRSHILSRRQRRPS